MPLPPCGVGKHAIRQAPHETHIGHLTARFAVSDSRIGAAKSTLTFLQNQIDIWNNQGK